jgi:hypothetical protein
MMNRQDLLRLREEFDSTDQSDAIERGTVETDVDPDPMVTTSIRLPKSLLDWVRNQAEAERIKSTALVRRWIEEKRDGGDQSMAARLERLERHVFGRGPANSGSGSLLIPPGPGMPEAVLRNANRLAVFIQRVLDDKGSTMDGPAFMDANAACQAIQDELPTVQSEHVRNALVRMIAAWQEMRDNRMRYNVDTDDLASLFAFLAEVQESAAK